MKLIQLSDLHLTAQGGNLHGRDPEQQLKAAIADINAHHRDADLVVISGDLSDDGSAASYAFLASALAELQLPWRVTMGNHDNREMFLAQFPTLVDENGFVQSVTAVGEDCIILLDSLQAGEVGGTLCSARLAWLEQQLQAAEEKNVFLFLHHPPMSIGLPALDSVRLAPEAADALSQVCHRFGNVRHISAGHVHRPASGGWRGISFSTVRGTNHQSALRFAPGFETSLEAPQYAIFLATEEGHTVHFHDFPGG
ncbi:phosphodiesterase [Pectobacterium carotovorum]|uniref:phosphodiesterase n=1 Tax=Pectobacterium carotovorum TaxID=554 RepID=UPI00208BFB61|nr:phosphodiesterase [Pectobacterium carotovorum]GKW38534.1 3',5'-cyclic adenosine monophosphate phosphodiesterase CpdA [Pectobacterium carotovorum subsp. carotovorum]